MKAKFVTRPSYQLQVSRWDGFSGLGLGQPVSEVGNCKAWVYEQDLGFEALRLRVQDVRPRDFPSFKIWALERRRASG